MHEIEGSLGERKRLRRRAREPATVGAPERTDRDRLRVRVDAHDPRPGDGGGDVEAPGTTADVQHEAPERLATEERLEARQTALLLPRLLTPQGDQGAPVGDAEGVAVVGSVVAIGRLAERRRLAHAGVVAARGGTTPAARSRRLDTLSTGR